MGRQISPVGPIPEDWRCVELGSAYTIHNNKRKPLSREQRQTMAGPYPYFGPTGVLDHINEFSYSGEFALIGEDGDNFLKFASQPMTLIASGRFNVNNHAHVIGDRNGNSVRWFQRFFEHRDITRRLTRQGVARYKLTKAALQELPMAIPPLDEQRSIAAVLQDVDDLIEMLGRLLAKKRDLLMGMMQELLTGATRLTAPVSVWRKVRIEEVLAPRVERHVGTDPLEVLSCTKHSGFVRSLDYFNNQVFSRNLAGYRVIRRGDIGYPANHVEEGSIGVQELFDVALVSPIYVVMRPLAGVDTYFLHRQLKLESYRQEFSRITNASVNRRGSLRWREFSQIEVLMPDEAEQRAVAQALRDVEAEIHVLERRRTKAAAVKQGMMQQLLTGQTRLQAMGAVA
jgi:type I restriction enzyme S subunit